MQTSAGGEERLDGGGVVSGGSEPTIFGAVIGPAEGSFLKISIELFEGWMTSEKSLDEKRVSVPGGPVKSGGAVLAEFGYRPACVEHEKRGGRVIVAGSVDQELAVGGMELLGEMGVFGEKRLGEGFVSGPAGHGELEVGRTLIQKKLEDLIMVKFFGCVVSGDVPAEDPLVDGAAGPGVDHGEIFVGDTEADGFRVLREKFLNEGKITKSGGHEEIGVTTAADEKACDVGAIREHVLGGSGFVIDVAGVDVCVMSQKELRDFDGLGEMERGLAVGAAGMDLIWIIGDEFFEVIHQAEARGGVDIDASAALDCVMGQIGRGAVEKSEAAGPPGACGIEISAGIEQGVEHGPAAGARDEGGS